MPYSLDDATIVVATLILLALSIVTIEFCRRDPLVFRKHTSRFLFSGKTFKYSFISNVGSIFSVTYFFGATFIYSCILGPIAFVIMVTGFLIAGVIILRILNLMNQSLSSEESTSGKRNLLLCYMRKKLSKRDFILLSRILELAFFALLVEELAVSRLVLNSLFPAHPAVTVLLLTMLCAVIYAYLSLGGFRAVLNSDFVQGVVLTAFVFVLIYLTSHGDLLSSIELSNARSDISSITFLVFFGTLLVSWLTMSIDSYSRLNFESKVWRVWGARRRLVMLSLVSTLVVLIVGILFAMSAASDLGTIESPSTYTRSAIDVFIGTNSLIVVTVFLVGLFCMIFTTIDTLLLNVLQIGFHTNNQCLKRKNLSLVFLLGVILSAMIPGDAVSAIGIYIASLLIIPFACVIRTAFPKLTNLIPVSNSYFIPSFFVSLTVFSFFYSELETEFSRHQYIPGITIGSLLLTVLILRTVELLFPRLKVDDN